MEYGTSNDPETFRSREIMAKQCGECGIKLGFRSLNHIDGVDYCDECAPRIKADSVKRKELQKAGVQDIFVVTMSDPPDKLVHKTLGPVSARAVVKLDILQDFFVNFMDDFGGRSGAVQRYFKKAEKAALQELRIEAAIVGANGVVDLRANYDLMEMKQGKIILVNMTGTAVRAATAQDSVTGPPGTVG